MVGAGNSAVQIAAELAEHVHVTLTTRKPVRFSAHRPLGRDLHFWLDRTGLDTLPIGPWLPNSFTTPVLDTGRYRTTLEQRYPDRRPMFTATEGSKVIWPDERREHVDAVIFATGYRPDLPYLSTLGTEHDRGVSRPALRPRFRRPRMAAQPLLSHVAGRRSRRRPRSAPPAQVSESCSWWKSKCRTGKRYRSARVMNSRKQGSHRVG